MQKKLKKSHFSPLYYNGGVKMKKIKKILFSLAAGVIVSLQALNASAEGFTKLDIGVGKTIISYSDINYGQYEDGDYFVRTTGAYPIKKDEIFVIYGSQNFIGNFNDVLPVSYTMYYDDGPSEDLTTNWQLGGWYARAYIQNNSGKDGYVEITDFGVPKGMLSDEVVEELDMRRVSQLDECNFDGFSAFAGTSEYYTTDKSYTLVTSNEVELTKEKVIENFYCVDNGMIIRDITVTDWNYEQKAGNYYANIFARDRSGNYKEYKLNIMVYEKRDAQILGPDECDIYLSQIGNFDINRILDEYSGDYYNQSYELAMSDDDINLIYNRMSYPNSFNVEIECEFETGDVIYKTITINIIDDIPPELFVKKTVYLTEELSKMTNDEIIIMVMQALREQGVEASSVLLSDEASIPTEEGEYKLDFTYVVEGETKNGVLNLNVIDSKKIEPVSKTILTASSITRGFDSNELLKLIGDTLLNKGISYDNLKITSDLNKIPSSAGDYNISFSYDSDGIEKEGELHLTLEDAKESDGINPIFFIIGGVALAGLSIFAFVKAKKRRRV